MATHQRKCILQETLIPSPPSWDSLTFHSHTVIRYQLSVQGGRFRGCSPAGGAHKGGWGGGGEEGVKDTGTLSAVGRSARLPPGPCLRARARSPGDPARAGLRPLLAHLLRARARPPARPGAPPLSAPPPPFPAHLPCSRPATPGTLPTCPLWGAVPFDLTSSPSGSVRFMSGAVPSPIRVILTDPLRQSPLPFPAQGAAGCGHLPRVMQT